MAITINGNGTVSGISVGGLPDGCVDTDTLASNAVNESKIADFFSSGAITLGGIRIQTGSFTSPSSVSDAGDSTTYPGARYWFSHTQSISGFASAPQVNFTIGSGYHDAFVGAMHETTHTSSQWRQYFSSGREGGIQSVTIYWVAIGDAS